LALVTDPGSTDNDKPLVTDEHRAKIGKKTPPNRLVIRATDAHRLRDLLGDDDPRYTDETGLAAPYAFSILEPRPTLGLGEVVPRVFPMGVLTQSEWTQHRPFHVDQPIFATYEVADIRERLGGRFGRSVLLMVHAEFRDEAGELLGESMHTITQYDPKGRARESAE
jgi:hypothetical protein